MQTGRQDVLARYAFPAWLALACLWSWPMFLAGGNGAIWPLLALLGPAAAAFVLLALTDGVDGIARLLAGFRPRWRHLPWLVVAILLPLLLVVPTIGFAVVTGHAFNLALAPVTGDIVALALLSLFVEIGFRAFALPVMLRQASPRVSALVVGFAWALWMAPGLLPAGTSFDAVMFGLNVLLLLASSVIFTWFWLKTRGSLWVSWALHATLILVAVDATVNDRVLPKLIVFVLLAALFALGRTLRRPRALAVDAVDAAEVAERERIEREALA